MKRIVAIGPESTGKSTLCASLATHFSAPWCPEFAREYLLKNGKDYACEDLLRIAKGQIRMEDEIFNSYKKNEGYYFIDTDLYVIKVWSEFVYGKCHPFILEQIAIRKYDCYLLCNTDLPWVEDPLREYPDEKKRLELFHIYKDLMMHQNTPWAIIKGNENNRLKNAIAALQFLEKPV